MKLRSSDNICRKRKKYISRRYSQIGSADGRREKISVNQREKISVDLREKKIRKLVHADIRRWKNADRRRKRNQRESARENSEKTVHAAYSKYQRKDVKKNIA